LSRRVEMDIEAAVIHRFDGKRKFARRNYTRNAGETCHASDRHDWNSRLYRRSPALADLARTLPRCARYHYVLINSVHFGSSPCHTDSDLALSTHAVAWSVPRRPRVAATAYTLRVAMCACVLAGLTIPAWGAWRATGPFGGDAEVIRVVPGQRDFVIAAS